MFFTHTLLLRIKIWNESHAVLPCLLKRIRSKWHQRIYTFLCSIGQRYRLCGENTSRLLPIQENVSLQYLGDCSQNNRDLFLPVNHVRWTNDAWILYILVPMKTLLILLCLCTSRTYLTINDECFWHVYCRSRHIRWWFNFVIFVSIINQIKPRRIFTQVLIYTEVIGNT